jgi:hypothetical protein
MKVIEHMKYGHIWFFYNSKYILKFIAFLKALKFKKENFILHLLLFFLTRITNWPTLTCLCPRLCSKPTYKKEGHWLHYQPILHWPSSWDLPSPPSFPFSLKRRIRIIGVSLFCLDIIFYFNLENTCSYNLPWEENND